MDVADHFAASYAQGRAKFLEAAKPFSVVSFEHPGRGPDGDRLFTDVAVVGEPSATKVLLANSATHGVEGFCGSGALTAWLSSDGPKTMRPDVRAVIVHAINPHGFAWLRRVNEDNVDLNRNFVDHDAPAPLNADYEALHGHLLPDDWTDDSPANISAALKSYSDTHGAFAMQAALSRGQYHYPDGVFYGGNAPVWSNRVFREIVSRWVAGASHVTFLDFHTGLGPFGHAELISKCEPNDPELARLRSWFGNAVKTSAAGESTSPLLHGLIAHAIRDVMPADTVSALTVEYGTYEVSEVLGSIIADNWLHARGERQSDIGRGIVARVKEAFYPDDDDWRELVGVRAQQLMRRALEGLAGV